MERNGSNDFYRVLFDESTAPAIVQDVATGRQYANKALAELLGCPPSETETVSLCEFVHADDREAYLALYDELCHGERDVCAIRLRIHRVNGTLIHASYRARAVRDGSGELRCLIATLEDVTELVETTVALKRAEEEARQNADYIRSALDAMPANAALLNPDGTIHDVNRAWRFFADENGLDRDAVGPGVDYLAAVERAARAGDDDAARALEGIRAVLEGESQLYTNVYPCHLAETTRWFQMVAAPVNRSQRDGAMILHVDITAQKLAEFGARESRDALETIVRSSPLPIATLDRDLNVATWNPAAERVLGWRSDEVVGRRNPAVARDEYAQYLTVGRRLLAGADTIRTETIGGRKDGTAVPVRIHRSGLRDASGNVAGVVAIFEDISELKANEQALADSERLFRTTFEASPIGIALIDGTGAFLRANRALERILNYTETELRIARDDFTHPEDVEPGLGYWRELLAGTRDTYRVEKRVRAKNGAVKIVSWTVAAVRDDAGAFLYSIHMVRDITSRKQDEAVLRKLSSVVERIADTVMITDRNGSIEYVNPAFEATTGYTANEVIGKTPRILKSGAHDTAFYERIWNELLAGHSVREVFVNRKKSGELYYEDKTLTPILDPSGQMTHFTATGRDVTRAREMENALRSNEARYRSLFESSSAGILVHDCASDTTTINDAFAAMLGYSVDEILALRLHALTHPDDVETTLRLYNDLLDGKRDRYSLEKRFVRKDGETICVNASVVAVRDSSRKLLYIVDVMVDITEQKRAMSALRESEARFRSLVESTDDLVFQLDETMRCVGIYGRWLERSRHTRDEFVGKDAFDIYGPALGQVHILAAERAISTGPLMYEWSMSTGDGERYFQTSLAPIPGADGSKGLVGITRDITALKVAEDNLRQLNLQLEARVRERTQELSDANGSLRLSNEELKQFASVVSHDLQEPLRTIANYVRMVQMRYSDRLDAIANDFIEYAVDGALRMQKMIRALLDYSRVDARSLAAEPVDMNALVGVVRHDLTNRLREAGGTVVYDALPSVSGDPVLLHRLLLNLVGNGIKFHCDAPPVVTITAEPDREAGLCRFAVRDNGIGIPEALLERIFMVFQRLHSDSEYEGEGIGLAVCRKIVTRHGGRIWAESRLGEGSTFYFTLPSA